MTDQQLMLEAVEFCKSKGIALRSPTHPIGVLLAAHILDKISASFRPHQSVTIVLVLDENMSGPVLDQIEALKDEFGILIGRYVLVDSSRGLYSMKTNVSRIVRERAIYWYTDRPASQPDISFDACFLVDLDSDESTMPSTITIRKKFTKSMVDTVLRR